MVTFWLAKRPACLVGPTYADYERRRNVWFAITLTAFLAHNFWFFILGSAFILAYTARRDPNKLAMFLFLLFVVPPISVQIGGFGFIEQLFTINFTRVLSLVILFPAFLFLRKEPDIERVVRPAALVNLLPGLPYGRRPLDALKFGRMIPDMLIVAYLLLQFVLQLQVDTLTNSLRYGVLYGFTDTFLPYYVASRSIKNLAGFRDALTSFIVAALVLSVIGCFEAFRHWLVYKPLNEALKVPWGMGDFLMRGEALRAQASTGHAIILGYVIAIAIGMFLSFRNLYSRRIIWWLGMGVLLVGIVAPISRGPWIGAAAILLIFVSTGPRPMYGFVKLGLVGLIVLPILMMTPAWDQVVSLMPFVGNVEEANVTYRQRLFQVSLQVIMENPWFGSVNYFDAPAMQQLIQGEGIIDIVNTYLGIALLSGFVGLGIFTLFFVTVLLGLIKGMREEKDKTSEEYVLGRSLVATLVGILIMIATCSNIAAIPIIYWTMAGLGVAYVRMLVIAKIPKLEDDLEEVDVDDQGAFTAGARSSV